MPAHFIVFEFSRNKVEQLDFRRFLELFTPQRLTSQQLRQAMGSLVFCLAGWETDEREVYLIPQIRRFYQELHKQWPWSLFFLNLDHDSLRFMVFCCMDNLTTIKVDGRAECGVEFDPVAVATFLGEAFPPMNLLCDRAGLSESEIFERTRRIFEYFQLPFEI